MTEPAGGKPAADSIEPAHDGAELLALIDRLESLLERSSLSEIEVEAGGTALVLRTPGAVPQSFQPAPTPAPAAGDSDAAAGAQPDAAADTQLHSILAPLTGLFYTAPSPGAQPYIREGGEVQAGQVIGLIEAMKLFNEIKSDVTGQVVRIRVETGALVKAKQPLIEVRPT